ncbi:PPE family protein [Mycobacterium sp. THU-M104]|uniref:PPE family protein n=1 Tax=Mycobacterium sp. THU-M104 TaxID=3410515 RepID=UPI003B9B2EF1
MIGTLDYGALPPEVNSARIYAGPRSGPMLAAASAWDGLASELHSTASAYESTISDLTSEEWLGPASRSLAVAVTPYIEWMSIAAAQAERIAEQATSAAAAYETAFTEHVPPTAIAANRTQLASLVATNVLGQNTPMIAANEAQYGEMWAQDSSAMYQYAGASATASKPRPFSQPPKTTDPAGQARQAAATTRASGNAIGGVANKMSGLQSALHQLSSPLGAASSKATGSSSLIAPDSDTTTSGLPGLLNTLDGATHSSLGTALMTTGDTGFPAASMSGFVSAGDVALIGPIGASAVHRIGLASSIQGGAVPGAPTVVSAVTPLEGTGGTVSAGMGRANLVGTLSAPQSWSAVAPANATTPATTAIPGADPGAGPEGAASMPGMPGVPGAPTAGAGERGSVLNYGMPRYGVRPTVMPKNIVG